MKHTQLKHDILLSINVKKNFLPMKIIFLIIMLTALSAHSTNMVSQNEARSVNNLNQQEITITGRVTDASTGVTIPGVSIQIEGTAQGTTTDINGEYTLNVSGPDAVLVFTYMGYITQTVNVGENRVINVSLVSDVRQLEEFVVVGYGVQKRANVTGAVATVDAASLESKPVTSVTAALQGLLPGATIIQGSGQPGKDVPSIRIRGIGTLNNSNPMFVVDGMVVRHINDLDPQSIESVTILKDAASASIYGSRASNGVVLITTKKGEARKPTLKYDTYLGFQEPTRMLEYLPSWEYADLFNRARINQGMEVAYTPEEIEIFRNGTDPDRYPNTDWQGLFYKRGMQQNHRAELSGGVENTTYMFSLGFADQQGIIEHAGYQRYNANSNITTKVNNFTASMNFSFAYRDIQEPTNPYTGDMYQIFRQINRISPWVPYQYSNGYYGYIADGNPLAWQDLGALSMDKIHSLRGIANLSYEPVKGLKFTQVLGYDYSGATWERFIKDIQFYNWQTEAPALYQGPNSKADRRSVNQLIDLQSLVSYSRDFGKHSIGALGGFTQEIDRYEMTYGYRSRFLTNELWQLNAGSSDGMVAEGTASEVALRSFFGRLTYNFDERYLFEANIRRDGTSRLHRDNRWGTFPSFSAGWRISNEQFMEDIKDVVSEFSLRAGWGRLGNQLIGDYPYQSVLGSRTYTFGGGIFTGRGLQDGVNQQLRWESSETTNIGLNLGLFEDQFTFSADYYVRNTYDILLRLPVPTPFGLSSPYQNAGEVLNKGVELQAGYRLKAGDWGFNIMANTAYNKNEVVNLMNDGARIWQGGFLFLQEGYPVDALGGYNALGLFRDQGDLDNSAVVDRSRAGLGDIKYEDINGDGAITAEDRIFLGSRIPKWTFGTSLGANFKGFFMDALLQGAAGYKAYLQNESVGRLSGSTTKPTHLFRDSYDQDTNPDGNFPRPLSTWEQNDSGIYPSSFWIQDAAYIRLKSLVIGYEIPNSVLGIVGMSGAKVYYTGHNLLTFTSLHKGWDPEAPAGTRAYYPQIKSHMIGLSVTF